MTGIQAITEAIAQLPSQELAEFRAESAQIKNQDHTIRKVRERCAQRTREWQGDGSCRTTGIRQYCVILSLLRI